MRAICWPNPDATCLEGGCIYCPDEPRVPELAIREYAESAGQLLNRGNGEMVDALEAYYYGHPRGGR